MTPRMRFPWNLIDRHLCLHCWAIARYDDPTTGKDRLLDAFRVARRCVNGRTRADQ